MVLKTMNMIMALAMAKLEFKKAVVTSGVHDGEEDNERHGLW
jgi:hypothetical protein